jgi:multicomponent Na+:H+ antiporter subunit G
VSVFIDVVSWICLVAGTAFCIIGAAGLIRMPDFYTRMHAASVTDTVGAGLILIGLMLQAGFTLVTAKLLIIAMLILLTSPAASHALARAAFVRGVRPFLHDGDAAAWKA